MNIEVSENGFLWYIFDKNRSIIKIAYSKEEAAKMLKGLK